MFDLDVIYGQEEERIWLYFLDAAEGVVQDNRVVGSPFGVLGIRQLEAVGGVGVDGQADKEGVAGEGHLSGGEEERCLIEEDDAEGGGGEL